MYVFSILYILCMSDMQNPLCVVVRPTMSCFSVNLIIPEGLDTPNIMH